MLESKNKWTGRDAARALAGLGSAAAPAIPALIKALGDDDGLLREAAAGALGKIGPAAAEAVPRLVELLRKDQYVNIRGKAAEALGDIGPTAQAGVPALVVAALRDFPGSSSPALAALLNIGVAKGQITPALEEALQWPQVRIFANDNFPRETASLLRKLGPDAVREGVEVLTRAAKDGKPPARANALRALGALGTDALPALPSVIECLRDDDGLLRKEVAIYRHGSDYAFVREIPVIAALRGIGPSSAPALIEALGHADPELRRNAALALLFIDMKTRQSLNMALEHSDPVVRGRAATFLPKPPDGVSEETFIAAMAGGLQDPFAILRNQNVKQLARFGAKAATAVPDLVPLLKDPVAQIRWSCGDALAALGPAGKTALEKVLDGDDLAMRTSAAAALVRTGAADQRLADALTAGVAGADKATRAISVMALVAFKGPEAKSAVPVLLKTLADDATWNYNQQVFKALSNLAPHLDAVEAGPVITAMIPVIRKEDSFSGSAANVLFQLAPVGGRAALESLLKVGKSVSRLWAAFYLVDLKVDGPEVVTALIESLKLPDAGNASSAAEALGKIGPGARGAVPALLELANTRPEVGNAVRGALKRIDPEASRKLGS